MKAFLVLSFYFGTVVSCAGGGGYGMKPKPVMPERKPILKPQRDGLLRPTITKDANAK
jgi:hypothetical protein